MIKSYFQNLYNFFFNYATPSNLTNVWNFGVLSFFFLTLQIISGLIISLYYVPNEDLSFIFAEYVMRDTFFGWYARYIHSNGASMFFFVVYLHFFRSLYYFSYIQPKLATWNTGVLVLVLMILAAFTGYVLPWGQMSFWAATVITNLASAIPLFGPLTVIVVWGSYSVSTYTLNRFYTIHFILPFIILAIVILHFTFLHEVGSSNNMRMLNKNDKMPFHPYYTIKDLLVVIFVSCIYLIIVNLTPNYLSHSDNYIPADSLSTPAHIVPEWYFLAFYAILRSVPDKLGGIIIMLASIGILFAFPYFVKSFYKDNIWSAKRFDFTNWIHIDLYFLILKRTNPTLQKYLFWIFVLDFIGLSYIGMKPVEEPYLFFGLLFTIIYFAYFTSSLYIHSFQLWLDLMKKFNKEFKWDLRFANFFLLLINTLQSIKNNFKQTTLYVKIKIFIQNNSIFKQIYNYMHNNLYFIFLYQSAQHYHKQTIKYLEKYIANK